MEKCFHPLTGDPLWKNFDEKKYTVDEIKRIVSSFIDEYPRENYELTIFDTISTMDIQIKCRTIDIPNAIETVFLEEKDSLFDTIGVNSFINTYQVGMEIKHLSFQTYIYKDNVLMPLITSM